MTRRLRSRTTIPTDKSSNKVEILTGELKRPLTWPNIVDSKRSIAYLLEKKRIETKYNFFNVSNQDNLKHFISLIVETYFKLMSML